MPAFVPDGPEVPERLLQAHEEGRVVFFCGAGISYPAGLPGFQDLVERVYAEIGESCDEVESMAYRQHRYDETFDLLERRLKDRNKDQLFVRKAVAKILEPKLKSRGAQDTHRALLDLSRDESGVTRLVTTNFDRIFEHVNRQQKRNVASFLAPLLPIPKVTKWDGIVYLHGGLLSKTPSAIELNRIVLSSGDFGLAYLNERWAARFVSELLKNFIVCFVGYSIEDPVLRYMMDALAADELLGEHRIESFAFASFKAGDRDSMERKWRAKGVEPLLFDQHAGGVPFAALHQTIQEWARVYTTGTHGKRMIVSTHAAFPPKILTRSDYAVGRMLWALTDPKAAKHFAELNPVPPLDWLEPLDEFLFDASDLCRFGVKEEHEEDDKRTFAMIRRPSPSRLSPWMELASDGTRWSNWDPVMLQLARWIVRHLGNPKLVLWVASRGGRLYPGLWRLIVNRLAELKKLEIAGDVTKLSEIRSTDPDGIPSSAMRKLWQLILADRIKGPRELDFYDWFSRLAVDGLTIGLKSELRDLLRPCVKLTKPYVGLDAGGGGDGGETVDDLVRWEIVPGTDHAGTAVRDHQAVPNWRSSLHLLLDDFLGLLREALALMDELGGPTGSRQLSVLHLPSIERHPQNRGHHGWTILVSLTRDSWLATLDVDPEKARQIAHAWWSEESPLFKRMALFAATQDGVADDAEAVGWLTSEGARWLWDITTKREMLRLLVALGNRWMVPPTGRRTGAQSVLERAILAGPPQDLISREESEEEFVQFRDRQIWLRLGKLSSGRYELGRSAAKRFERIGTAHPEWAIAENQRDEFAVWMQVGFGDGNRNPVPAKPRALLKWLEDHPSEDRTGSDSWRDLCRTHFRSVAMVLVHSYAEGKWHPERLSSALYVWAGDGKLLLRSWRSLGAFLAALTDQQKIEILNGLAWWVKAGGNVFEGNDDQFQSLVVDLIRLGKANGVDSDRDVMFRAINHPIGQATEAALEWWSCREKKGGGSLDGWVKDLLTQICNPSVIPFRNGRTVLAQSTAWLYAVDREWTIEHLVPLFDWSVSMAEAAACWTGFLYSPRRIPGLLAALKEPFLQSTSHLDKLSADCRDVFAQFYTYVALEPAGVFSHDELRSGFARFEVDDLENSARALSEVMEGAGDKAEALWQETVRPLIEKIWPKGADRRSDQISGHFAAVSIAANDEFPNAVEVLRPYFQPTSWTTILLGNLSEKHLHQRFPREALDLTYRVVGESPRYPPRELDEILRQIGEANPKLKQLNMFKKLRALFE
jgi:hypothetical protein